MAYEAISPSSSKEGMKMSLSIAVKSSLKGSKMAKGKTLRFSSKGATLILLRSSQMKKYSSAISKFLAPWQKKKVKDHKEGLLKLDSQKGPMCLFLFKEPSDRDPLNHEGLLENSYYSEARDLVGSFAVDDSSSEVVVNFIELDYDHLVGAMVGLDMAYYDYQKKVKTPNISFNLVGELPLAALKDAQQNATFVGEGISTSRFLVDTPSGEKRPDDYAKAVKKLFDKRADVKVTVWDDSRLKKEKMGLMLGVGMGASQKPRMVKISYRPKKSATERPVAFVGKGITFDTGGLNIKTGNYMRLMKKDMGGSASLVGLAHAVTKMKLPIAADFYLALAENAVDENSFRPGDVLTARNGKRVEIDNTDAEGRLVLGDTLAVATEEKPLFLVDVATLTGAAKVALGADVAAVFSNDDALAYMLQNCSQLAGEPVWRMPLVKSQREMLKSDVADFANSTNGHGGAIRAAMFLQEFTGKVPWAHFDIYSWIDSKVGPYRQSGGSGQMVQTLTLFLSQLAHEEQAFEA